MPVGASAPAGIYRLRRLDMIAEPLAERLDRQIARREGEERHDEFDIAASQTIAIQYEKSFAYDRSRPLVAIDERVVARDTVGIASRQFRNIRVASARARR